MSSPLIYIAGDANSSNMITKEFKLRALNNMTIGRLSSIHILAKPTEPQYAYGGYKSAIEAFVAATIRKQKLLTSAESYPLPADYIPSCPLPLPQIICKLKSHLTTDQVRKIVESWKEGRISVVEGAHGPTFEIMEPTWKMVFTSLPVLANPQTIRVDKRAQVEEVFLLRPIYQFIDGFLATNTYPYKKEHFKPGKVGKLQVKYLGERVELRNEDSIWRSGFGSGKLQKVDWESDVTTGRRIGSEEPEDLTPHMDTQRTIGNSVFVAKPSPLPSSTSFGAPSAVPNVGGLIFPYFPGMLMYDLAGVRDLIGRLIFRCLGDHETTPRDAYKKLRNSLGSSMNTPQGLILGHVLKGIELSLDAQAQLFLLFDKKVYLGFCLLGEEFHIWSHGSWRKARTPEELRDDLKLVTTTDQAQEELVAKLQSLNVGIETAFLENVTRETVASGSTLLGILGQLEDAKGVDEVERAEIVALIGRCNLPSAYKLITPANIAWAVEQITLSLDQAFDDSNPIYVPVTGWSESNNKVYRVLASFGPRSFSFRNATGETIKLVDVKDKSVHGYRFIQVGERGMKEPYPFIVYTKTIRECVKDWRVVMDSGEVKMDFVERAGGIRGNKFYGVDKGSVIKVFSDAIIAKKFPKKVDTKPDTDIKGKGKAKEVDNTPINDDDLDQYL